MRYLLIFIFLAAVFLGHYAFSGQAVYGDGIDYWAYLHSWYFDHDTNFNNEYRHQYDPKDNNSGGFYLTPHVQKTRINQNGTTDNIHPAGTSLFLLPFYILADLLVRLANIFGWQLAANGYSDFYQITCGLGAVLYTVIAFYLTERLCIKFSGSRTIGFWASLGVLLCTPMLYYGSYDIINSHFISYLLSVSFWLVFFTADLNKSRWLFLISALASFAGLVRIQDVFLFIPLLLKLRRVDQFLLSGLVGIIIFLPQFYNWWYLYGVIYPYTYATTAVRESWWGSLFHPINGWIRTPVMFLSFWGFGSLGAGAVYFMSFLIPSFLAISFYGGWAAPAYGARMYISSLPFIAVLLAVWFKKLSPKFYRSFIIFFFIINMTSLTSFVFFEKEVNSGRKRGLEENTVIKLQQLIKIL